MTFLIATTSPVSVSFAYKTTPKLPFPAAFSIVYGTYLASTIYIRSSSSAKKYK